LDAPLKVTTPHQQRLLIYELEDIVCIDASKSEGEEEGRRRRRRRVEKAVTGVREECLIPNLSRSATH